MSVILYDDASWYVADDRQMYRPGEEVHVKGWLRVIGGGQEGDVSQPGGAISGLRFSVISGWVFVQLNPTCSCTH